MSHFPCEPGSTGPELAVENDRSANTFADGDVEKIPTAAPGADFELAIGRRIGVVFELKSQAGGFNQFSMKAFANYPGNVSRGDDAISLPVNQTRYGNPDSLDVFLTLA